MCICVLVWNMCVDARVYIYMIYRTPTWVGKHGPNPVLGQLVHKDLKRYKPAPSDTGVTSLTREWVHIMTKPSAFKKVTCKYSKKIPPHVVLRCVQVSCHLASYVNAGVDCTTCPERHSNNWAPGLSSRTKPLLVQWWSPQHDLAWVPGNQGSSLLSFISSSPQILTLPSWFLGHKVFWLLEGSNAGSLAQILWNWGTVQWV